MSKTINELLHTSNKAIPDTRCPEDLANYFGRFFVGKVTTIRDKVDRQSIKLNYHNIYPVKYCYMFNSRIAAYDQ